MSPTTPNPQIQPAPPGQPAAPVQPGVPVQPAPQQNVTGAPVVPQPVVYVPVQAPPEAVPEHQRPPDPPHEVGTSPEHKGARVVYIYSHSNLFYWWPVWLAGYIMALITYLHPLIVDIRGQEVMFHTSKNLGVIFTFTFFLVILITNVTLRGLSSVVVIFAVAFGVLLMAYFDLWGYVLEAMGKLTIYMNIGFYLLLTLTKSTDYATMGGSPIRRMHRCPSPSSHTSPCCCTSGGRTTTRRPATASAARRPWRAHGASGSASTSPRCASSVTRESAPSPGPT
jgi:hypothetical protein